MTKCAAPKTATHLLACAAAVTKPAEVLALEIELAELRSRRDQLRMEHVAASAGLSLDNKAEVQPILRRIADEQAVTEGAIASVRQRYAVERVAYAEAVKEALAPHRAAAQVALVDAYDSLIESWHILDIIACEVKSAGATAAPGAVTAAQGNALFSRIISSVAGGEAPGLRKSPLRLLAAE
jgi:hypothetical protein